LNPNTLKEKFTTADGSDTFFMPEFNEYYHSHHGAIQEAKHVFIKNGLQHLSKRKSINILEVGLGTALNALLTVIEAHELQIKINYLGLEAFPLSNEQLEELNYSKLIDDKNSGSFFEKIKQVEWGSKSKISDFFEIEKVHNTLQEIKLKFNHFDLIYYDAFGPRAQEEMWHLDLFEKLYNSLKTNGVFVTYCAKGQVKRDLKSLGFQLESLPGPPGKREMIRATKI
jgi:tRNA U34 5-methylaminomethyl-2-thiouridine-forming methyltransferase MnmC